MSATRSTRPRKRKRAPTLATIQAAVTNGTRLVLDGCDHRTRVMRRWRDLLTGLENDLGGRDHLGAGQAAIVKRAAMLVLQCELLEAKFSQDGGAASSHDLELYQRSSNSLRRLIESVGLNTGRTARSVNGAGANGAVTLDHIITQARVT